MPDHYPDTETTSEDTSSGVHARANFDKSSGTGKLANITRRVTIRLGKVEKRSTINAEKITKLKNITQLRKKNVDKKISGSSVLLDSLNGINDSLNGMLGILGDRERFDAQIADCILELFRKREAIDVFNKKALYIYIREMIDVKTPKITKIANKLHAIYKEKYIFFQEYGYFPS